MKITVVEQKTTEFDKKIANLKKGEIFCFSCDKKIKSKNLKRHTDSLIHNKNVDRIIQKRKKELRIDMSEFAGEYSLKEIQVVIKKMKKKVKKCQKSKKKK